MRGAPGLRDRTVELVQSLDRPLPFVYLVLKLLPHLSLRSVLTLDGLPQMPKLSLFSVDEESLVPNIAHNGFGYVVVGLVAKKADLETRLAIILVGIEVVMMCAQQENDVAGCKEENPVAFAAFAHIKSGAFEVRSDFGSDPQTECGSEWAAHVGDRVYKVNGLADRVKTDSRNAISTSVI